MQLLSEWGVKHLFYTLQSNCATSTYCKLKKKKILPHIILPLKIHIPTKLYLPPKEPTKSPSQLRYSPGRRRCCPKPLEMLPKSTKESATKSAHSKEPSNLQAAWVVRTAKSCWRRRHWPLSFFFPDFFFLFSNFHYPRYNLFNFSNFAHVGYKNIYPIWVVCKFESRLCSRFAYGIRLWILLREDKVLVSLLFVGD